MLIKKTKKADQLKVLKTELSNLTLPPKFKLPLSPKMEVKGIIPEKCKVMDSKKLPLWLVFENADTTGQNIFIIFKAGDDLRQDLLTLQMLKIMDKLWKQNSLDLHMQPYG
jgi:phosphatidylinositol kinase/protein kinase (PI-3  family)